MKKDLIALLGLLGIAAASPAAAQQANWLTGVYTLAAGPDNIYSNFAPSAYCYYIAWVSDRPVSAGYMVSDCTNWISDQGATGAAATIAVGSVSPLSPGSAPTVANVGSSVAAILNFGLTTGATGSAGTAGVNAFGSPTTRTLSLATAYQATTTTKPAVVTVNLTSTASLSLSGGTTNTADVLIGSTNAVASGTGSAMCKYANTNTGALTIGLALSTSAASTCTFALPTGWFFAVRQTAGAVTITSAFDQQVG